MNAIYFPTGLEGIVKKIASSIQIHIGKFHSIYQ